MRSPDGQTWRVSRRWVPWRRRLKGWLDAMPSTPGLHLGDDPISLIIGLILLLVAIPIILIMLVAGLELLLLLLVLPFAILGRVLLGRHWTVEVRRGWAPYWEERSGGWQESRRRIHALAEEIARGEVPEANVGKVAAAD